MKSNKTIIAFDLDGTIIDSQEGIINCIRYVLDFYQLKQPPLEELLCFIGPPLGEQFQKVFGFSKEQAIEGVDKFRERFDVLGWKECQLYPGIKELIQALHGKGTTIALASSKHQDGCEKILSHFQLDQYFTLIAGATRDGSRSSKEQVLDYMCKKLKVEAKSVVLVGDTRFDVIGAKQLGAYAVGITYGFGSKKELIEAGADRIFESVKEVGGYLVQI